MEPIDALLPQLAGEPNTKLFGCLSVASRSDGGTGGIAGPSDAAIDASHDSSAGTGGAIVGTGGSTGSTDASAVDGNDASSAGTGGVAGGTGGATGVGGGAATCTGSGICGRGATGIYCAQSNGANGFASWTQWSDNYSDAASWKSMQAYCATIQFPDLDGDGKADVCGRSAAGMLCGKSNGTAFSVTNWLTQYTDVNGWKTDLSYGASLQTPNLNVTGCTAVTKKSVYTQPLERRLAPF